MSKKKIGVIGAGGRTGTMFGFELQKAADILGIGRGVSKIKEKKLFVQRKDSSPELYEGEVIEDSQFSEQTPIDILFLATKNPVGPAVKYYYQKVKGKGKLPDLIISQNGISASSEALDSLKEALGQDWQKVRVIRTVLFNPIDIKEIEGKTSVIYSLPIRIGFSKISGPGDLSDIGCLFKEAGFEAEEYPSGQANNMDFSKLFLNLIGMASAVRGSSIDQGIENPEIFKEEIEALKEYIKSVIATGGSFLNFPHYPVKTISSLIEILPVWLLSFFKGYFSKIITKGRKGKKKDLGEIDYYNGAVVKLGERNGIATPANQNIVKRAHQSA